MDDALYRFMSRVVSFAIFLSFSIAIVAAIHFYFWARLARDPGWPHPWRLVVSIAIASLACLIPLGIAVGWRVGPPWSGLFLWPAYIWMGVMFLLLIVLLTADAVRLLVWISAKFGAKPIEPERRLLLARLIAGGSTVVSTGLGIAALRGGLRLPEVRRVAVRLSRLPEALSGTTIVQITDLHVGSTVDRAFVEALVERCNSLSPDLVAVTGDLVDGTVAQLGAAVAPLRELTARYGVYFVTGNHEYYSGVKPWLQELERLGMRVLRNERVSIGTPDASFDLGGVDDWRAARMRSDHGPDIAAVVAGRDLNRELVLLAHQPAQIEAASQHGVGLQISGHTHGGQIWPFGYLVHLTQPYLEGLHRHGSAQIYVSRGAGHWGPPMRLGAPAELSLIELVAGTTPSYRGLTSTVPMLPAGATLPGFPL